MKPWTFKTYCAWQGTAHVIVEIDHALHYFRTADDAINWLFLNGHKDAARSLNAHCKGEH